MGRATSVRIAGGLAGVASAVRFVLQPMDSEEFIRALKIARSDSEGAGTIEALRRPPGRRPSAKLARLSKWFLQLSGENQQMLLELLNDFAENTIFGFLCVLDGVRAIENGPDQGALELYYVKRNVRVRLNDPSKEELHNLFQGMRSFD